MEPEKDVFEEWEDDKSSRPWIKRKAYSIYLWWNHEGKYMHLEFQRGIKNLMHWFPIIWKDRNWDSHYIFEILKYKLESQAKHILDRDFHTRAKYDAGKMMLCVGLIEIVQEGTYSSEYSDYHKTKHWFEPINDGKGTSTWESRVLEENFDNYFKKYPLIYKRVLNGEGVFPLDTSNIDNTEVKQRIAMNIGHINQNRARKLLFKIMESQIENWWD